VENVIDDLSCRVGDALRATPHRCAVGGSDWLEAPNIADTAGSTTDVLADWGNSTACIFCFRCCALSCRDGADG